jgi:hypothetical protein
MGPAAAVCCAVVAAMVCGGAAVAATDAFPPAQFLAASAAGTASGAGIPPSAWGTLSAQLTGTVVTPGNPSFTNDTIQWNRHVARSCTRGWGYLVCVWGGGVPGR